MDFHPEQQACVEVVHTTKVGLVTDKLLQLHSQETVTCYGTQRSVKHLEALQK